MPKEYKRFVLIYPKDTSLTIEIHSNSIDRIYNYINEYNIHGYFIFDLTNTDDIKDYSLYRTAELYGYDILNGEYDYE